MSSNFDVSHIGLVVTSWLLSVKQRDVGDFDVWMKQEAEDKKNLTEKHTHMLVYR